MNSFFGLRPIVACQAVVIGLAVFLFIPLTTTESVFVAFTYLVLRGVVAEEW